jgi:hypothetical protein
MTETDAEKRDGAFSLSAVIACGPDVRNHVLRTRIGGLRPPLQRIAEIRTAELIRLSGPWRTRNLRLTQPPLQLFSSRVRSGL